MKQRKTTTTLQQIRLYTHNLIVTRCREVFLSATFYNLLQRTPIQKALWIGTRFNHSFKNGQKLQK